MFWTAAIPDSDVDVNFGAGRAEMHVRNLAVEDYFKLQNALADGPEVDATVSFDVVWSGPVTRRLNVQNTTALDPFAGEFVENQVTVSWSGSNANGFSFTSNPGDFSTSVDAFSELSHNRNGRFLSDDSGGGDRNVATLLTNILAERSLISPSAAGNGIASAAPSAAPSAFHFQLVLGAGSQASITNLAGAQHVPSSSTAILDHVFATIAVNPLDHGPYQGLFSDPAGP